MSVVLDVNADTWNKEILQADTLVLVEFWHENCPWCIRVAPIFSEVAEVYGNKVKFAKLNVLENDQNRQIAIQYGIMGTPSLVFFCEGRSIEMVAGFQQKERLEKLIDEVIEKHRECLEKSTKLEISP